MVRRFTMWAAALLCVSAPVCASASVAAAGTGVPAGSGAAALVVRTDKGLVRGVENSGAREFLGLPYASPPLGRLRWRPPQPAARWRGIRDAGKPGNVCAQNGSIATGVPVTSTAEDCLYLNVYTPAAPGFRPRPVMVWIHGGGFTGGAGSIFDGAPLAVTGNVVIVTINYRLGPFGFLALPSLDAESHDGSSGDYGLMDQQAALRWVQRNARAFGGDPRDVTIFGQSAGGASACDNMASPTASGLFEHAIAESGCLQPSQNQQQADQHDTSFAAHLGCDKAAAAAACLRGKPVTSLLAAGGVPGGWTPVVGGRTLPLQPSTAFTTGRYAHVPLLQGTNHDDERLTVGFEFGVLGPPMTAAQYPAILKSQFGAADAAKIEARYPLSAYPSPGLAYASVLTDSQSSCPALATDTLVSRSGGYAYEFSDPNPPNDFGVAFSFPLGDAHSTELQYVFGKIPSLGITPPFTAGQFTLSAQMMKYWSRFAATGNPNGGGAPFWPAFDPARQRIEELTSTGIAPATSFGAYHQCAFWAETER
jgi:para-nitrobenzyl esterase